MTLGTPVIRLNDDEIFHIYRRVLESDQPQFLKDIAGAILSPKKRQDFLILRPIAVLFIAKYGLGCYLASVEQPNELEKSA